MHFHVSIRIYIRIYIRIVNIPVPKEPSHPLHI
jgi:hypothetical protein